MFIVVYLNDILVYSKTYEEYIGYVRSILTTLRDIDLRIKLEKTKFYRYEVKFLRYIISREGLKMDLKKVEAIIS